MEDQELVELRDLKAELFAKANDLLKQLKDQEGNGQKCLSTSKLMSDSTKDTKTTESKLTDNQKHELCKVTRQVTGIRFENIDRQWLKNDIYQYNAKLITAVLELLLELKVKIEGEKEFEIQGIMCHFIGLDNCYMLEIQSWIQKICRRKNFSLLASAISQYSDQHKARSTILEQLTEKKYANSKQCTDDNGGITVFVHSPRNVKQVYLQFQWSLLFIEQTWRSEHIFVIHPSPEGADFTNKYQDLVQKFCDKPIDRKRKVRDLWEELCTAIDSYEDSDERRSSDNNNSDG
ncbi:PREDICTED: uncharacterized protein LOC107193917 [Dufourea novaeangliae]|uniref:Uncharacterized protein n=1 Tax=Dufourea novaeangliae TaxID=178035 RepID=A0A154P354_DUFNO|nr:PREDICTED: uncharacterized protein LOC107193917 [Dufourea novaeangliae]KZC05668.1 hypothetical protein WN55_04608 [Dufourea novaeangliae]